MAFFSSSPPPASTRRRSSTARRGSSSQSEAATARSHARIDCNRARGGWKSARPGQLEFGPMAATRAQCPPGSLHDQLMKQLPFVRSYLVREGKLYLSLMADGGTLEFTSSP